MRLPVHQRGVPRGFAIHRRVATGLLAVCVLQLLTGGHATGSERLGMEGRAVFRKQIQPVLTEFCYDCHADGANEGGVAFDEFKSDEATLQNPELWWKALKNLRAGLMPPVRKPQPTADQKERIEQWIKTAVFKADPKNPDPGRVTARRLNRAEYRNTIRDLIGIDFNTEAAFPPDDAGHGFDNIGDVLTLSPMLLEKYFDAARTIVSKAVPMVPAVPAERIIEGKHFRRGGRDAGSETNRGPLSLSYYDAASVAKTFTVQRAGRYQILLDLTANERYVDSQFDYNKCRLVFKADGEELHNREYTREGGKAFHYEFDRDWPAGEHEMVFELEPLTPDQKQVRSLTIRIDSVTVRGPLDERDWVKPRNHERFFGSEVPADREERRIYARKLLGDFARKAFRRPVDEETVERLAALAEETSRQPGKTFEAGVAQAMAAVLASPRFIFREEAIEPGRTGAKHPFVDQYALASRLSYFLWSSMPDDELLALAEKGRLRNDLGKQFKRMLADPRADGLTRNFVGQWLQARDIESVPIEARQVLAREAAADPELEKRRQRFRELRNKPEESLSADEKGELEKLRGGLFRNARPPRAELTGDLRRAMRQETERAFEYILREDRNVLELIDSDWTFLNERLAKHYGITNVLGDEMRRVTLPLESPRGGILTHGTVLTVTSNPTRTSPVKRGLFVLDNILGLPPAPPPPDIPALEDAGKGVKDRALSLREMLALHREKPLCSSCHDRMDPLGLALENFNAMGMWRDKERNEPIDAAGTLVSGENFNGIKELKGILATKHSLDFYRTLTEKLLTYALGRGLEYYDVQTVDQIVDRLVKADGRPSALLMGIIDSAAFQRTRNSKEQAKKQEPATDRADARIEP